ncbi:MAG: helix-turn-helix transcriptional regulator [Thermoanaerobaculia bacterium]|nr:helix-turn-helix transcriptional regulator [Thermoanaerobaculia bacterium]MBP9825907.1 helix-turn-helix transcriptional regulator [Thermoanaerobaculia bacterium]
MIAEDRCFTLPWEVGTRKCHTFIAVTAKNLPGESTCAGGIEPQPLDPRREALVRQMLGRVADQWTLEVLEALDAPGVLRFTELRTRVGGISQKMLTKTVRQLERDGLVTRKVHAVVPPRVDYRLTPLGRGLGEAVCGIWTWVEAHVEAVEAARRDYDRRTTEALEG